MATAAQVVAESIAFGRPGEATNDEQIQAFYLAWEGRLRKTISSYGFSPEDVDDIFQDLMMVWLLRDYISKYDSEKGAVSTFVYSFFKPRVRHEYLARRAKNGPLTDLEATEYQGTEQSFLDDSELMPMIEEDLKQVPKLLSKDKKRVRDMHRLFVDLQTQIAENGKKNQVALAKRYGMSSGAVTLQMNDLRRHLVERGWVEFDDQGYVSWVGL